MPRPHAGTYPERHWESCANQSPGVPLVVKLGSRIRARTERPTEVHWRASEGGRVQPRSSQRRVPRQHMPLDCVVRVCDGGSPARPQHHSARVMARCRWTPSSAAHCTSAGPLLLSLVSRWVARTSYAIQSRVVSSMRATRAASIPQRHAVVCTLRVAGPQRSRSMRARMVEP